MSRYSLTYTIPLKCTNYPQVDGNGFSWRSGAKVELLNLKQWFLRITNFKESLLADLDSLAQDNHWPERVLSMQRNWLGRSQGANIRFGVVNEASAEESILVEVFTTRPDTLYGVQYLALSVTHPLVVSLCQTNLDLKCFVDRVPSLSIDSKEGFLLSGFHARNPLSVLEDSPATMRKGLPVYVAPYVLGNYGQGAVMGVPGHDARDYAFWNQNRGDENVLRVIVPADFRGNPKPLKSAPSKGIEPFVGKLSSACEGLAGFSCADASLKIMQDLGKAGKLAEKVETWRLRDWLISRQRYWGTPIPIIHCQKCGTVPVPEDELPVVLPKLNGDRFRGKGGNPIEALDEWVNKSCPKCNGKARRETDTMDTFMDSSWYFMRLADPHNAAAPFSAEAAEASLPVDIYIGGVEHAILHLLYARFVSKFFASTSFWPSGGGKKNAGEPFRRLVSQGMVHGKTYSNPETGRFLKLDEIDLSDPSKPRMVANGQTPIVSWEKMSKSKYNGVDPSGCIKKYGADATRAHVLFQAPVSEVLEWDETRIVGIQRWLGRVWRLVLDTRRVLEKSQLPVNSFSSPMLATPLNPPLPNPATLTEKETHQWGQLQRTILSITTNLSETFTLNTIISDLMELTNTLHHPNQYSNQPVNTALQYHTTNTLLRMLAPVAPAFAEECWERLHSSLNSGCDPPSIPSIFESPFPQIDSSVAALQTQVQTCIVQENGRWRLAVEIPKPSPELMERVNEADLKGWVVEQIEKTVEGKAWSKRSKDRGFDWKRVIVVKGGRVVNFVD